LSLAEGLRTGTGAGLEQASAAESTLRAPVAHWTFDEGAGTTAADTCGNGRNFTLTGAAVWGGGRTGVYVPDVTGGGSATSTAPVTDTSAAFSAAAWVRLDSVFGCQTLVSVDGSAVGGFYLRLRDGTDLEPNAA
jgi:alpha-N-arabinofuranosidase